MIYRTLRTDLLEVVVNDGMVKPWISDNEPWMPLIVRDDGIPEDTLLITNGESAFLVLQPAGPGYSAHWLFGRGCRGRAALETARQMLAFAKGLGVNLVWGYTPKAYRHAVWFNRQLGGVAKGETDDEILFEKEL